MCSWSYGMSNDLSGLEIHPLGESWKCESITTCSSIDVKNGYAAMLRLLVQCSFRNLGTFQSVSTVMYTLNWLDGYLLCNPSVSCHKWRITIASKTTITRKDIIYFGSKIDHVPTAPKTFWDCIWSCFLGFVYTFPEGIRSTRVCPYWMITIPALIINQPAFWTLKNVFFIRFLGPFVMSIAGAVLQHGLSLRSPEHGWTRCLNPKRLFHWGYPIKTYHSMTIWGYPPNVNELFF